MDDTRDKVSVSIYLNAAAKLDSDYSILTANQTLHSGMVNFEADRAEKVEIKSDLGTVVLLPDGSWYYRSSHFVLHPENI
jgi:hypothetical protein